MIISKKQNSLNTIKHQRQTLIDILCANITTIDGFYHLKAKLNLEDGLDDVLALSLIDAPVGKLLVHIVVI